MAMASRRIVLSSLRGCCSFIRSLTALPPSKLPPDRIPQTFNLAFFCRSGALPCATAGYPHPPCSSLPDSLQQNLHHNTRKLSKPELRAFKSQLLALGPECISLKHFVEACKQQGMASSNSEAKKLVMKLEQSGFLLLFRSYVFLRPEKIAHDFLMALPFSLSPLENDPRQEEFSRLQKEKEEIDQIARSQARSLVWAAFGGITVQSLVFFRLTFWDLSWDVMEPVTFFTMSGSLLNKEADEEEKFRLTEI